MPSSEGSAGDPYGGTLDRVEEAGRGEDEKQKGGWEVMIEFNA